MKNTLLRCFFNCHKQVFCFRFCQGVVGIKRSNYQTNLCSLLTNVTDSLHLAMFFATNLIFSTVYLNTTDQQRLTNLFLSFFVYHSRYEILRQILIIIRLPRIRTKWQSQKSMLSSVSSRYPCELLRMLDRIRTDFTRNFLILCFCFFFWDTYHEITRKSINDGRPQLLILKTTFNCLV